LCLAFCREAPRRCLRAAPACGGVLSLVGVHGGRRLRQDLTEASSISSVVVILGSKVGDAGIFLDAVKVVGWKGIRPLLSSGGLIRGGGLRSLADLLHSPAMAAGIGAALLRCCLCLGRLCSCFSLLYWPASAAGGWGWGTETLPVFGGLRSRCLSATPPGLLRCALACFHGGGGLSCCRR
jgi:hypothetical protein